MDMLKTACDVHAGRRSEKTAAPFSFMSFSPNISFLAFTDGTLRASLYRVQSHKRCPLQTRCVFNNFQIDPVQWRQQQRRHIHSSATREIHTVNQL